MNTCSSIRNIVCMKWGTKYAAHYVNRLYGMVKRNITGQFNFICLTDDTSDIRQEVICYPIPELNWQRYPSQPDRAWKKLATFAPALTTLYGLRGSALFIDLDIIVIGCLDDFFTLPGAFRIIRDYPRPWRSKKRIIGNSSVYRFELGKHSDILEYFQNNVDQVQQNFRNEQAFLSDFLHRQGQLDYWPSTWCPSFKYQCIPAWPSNYWKPPIAPKEARIVIFHGECNPPDALVGRRNKPFCYIKPSNWIDVYWRE